MSNDGKTVDARGLSCPQPILETKRAIELASGGGEISVLVDTETSRLNVARYAENAGWSVTAESVGDYFKLLLKK
jgi:TusA-related sulfurtransferase